MKRSWSGGISEKQWVTLLWWSHSESCLSHDPLRKNKICTGSYFVSRTVWAVFSWGKRGRGNRHKWSNYLGMRSLFGSISSRLWPSEAQPSSTTGCVISSLRPARCTRTFFSEFGWGTFCPAVGFVIRPLLSNRPSDRLLTSSNKKFILDVSAEENAWCMYVLKTAL